VTWPPPATNGDAPERGRPFWIIFIDFGMVGHLPEEISANLRQVLVSVTQRDTRKLTEAYDNLGFFVPGADLERIAEAQDAILEQIWGRKLLDLAQPDPEEMQELGQEFRDILFDFPFQIPQDFIYLGRAIGIVSGLVSQLNPEINPWAKIEQYGRSLIRSQDARQAGRDTLLAMLRPYLTAPMRAQRVLEAAESGQLRVQSAPTRETKQQWRRIERRLGYLSWSLLGAGGMVASALVYLARQIGRNGHNGEAD
jgi:predicted unusual protein kinase regulating ubiquinone biosynthesis (AarF/ABC1/UbiB family)